MVCVFNSSIVLFHHRFIVLQDGQLTESSAKEQANAGLGFNALTPQEITFFTTNNDQYKAKASLSSPLTPSHFPHLCFSFIVRFSIYHLCEQEQERRNYGGHASPLAECDRPGIR